MALSSTEKRSAFYNFSNRVWQRWKTPLLIFAVFRLALFIFPFISLESLPLNYLDDRYKGIGFGYWEERLAGTWLRFDANWYLDIAEKGYYNEPQTAFFPLFPLLIKFLGIALGGNYGIAALVISNLSTLAVFILLYEIAHHEYQNEQIARNTLLFIATYPTAFYFLAAYTESLFMALTLGALLAMRRYRNWAIAAGLGALATLTRNIGVLLVVPLLWEWWQANRLQKLNHRIVAQVLFLFLPVLALAGHILALWSITGSLTTLLEAQSRWGRHFSLPWDTLVNSLKIIIDRPPHGVMAEEIPTPILELELFFFIANLIFFMAVCYYGRKGKILLSYILFDGLAILVPLLSAASYEPLMSFPRFSLVLFPSFFALAHLTVRHPGLRLCYFVFSVLLFSLMCACYFARLWIG